MTTPSADISQELTTRTLLSLLLVGKWNYEENAANTFGVKKQNIASRNKNLHSTDNKNMDI